MRFPRSEGRKFPWTCLTMRDAGAGRHAARCTPASGYGARALVTGRDGPRESASAAYSGPDGAGAGAGRSLHGARMGVRARGIPHGSRWRQGPGRDRYRTAMPCWQAMERSHAQLRRSEPHSVHTAYQRSGHRVPHHGTLVTLRMQAATHCQPASRTHTLHTRPCTRDRPKWSVHSGGAIRPMWTRPPKKIGGTPKFSGGPEYHMRIAHSD